jgi:hypothetical protein
MSKVQHAYEVDQAIRHGIPKAVLLYNIRFWLDKNKANVAHTHDGYVWTYNSGSAFAELFPEMTTRSIQRHLLELENAGVLLSSSKYNKAGFDRTKWYTIPQEYAIRQNGGCTRQNGGPIPDISPDINKHVACIRTPHVAGEITYPEREETLMLKESYAAPVSRLRTSRNALADFPVSNTAAEAVNGVEARRVVRKAAQAEKHKGGKFPTYQYIGRIWRELCAETYPAVRHATLTQRGEIVLRGYALSYCRQDGKTPGDKLPFENFSKYMEWVVTNWRTIVDNHFVKMGKVPEYPDTRLFTCGSTRGKFEDAYRKRKYIESVSGMDKRERMVFDLVQGGMPEHEAKRRAVAKYGTIREEQCMVGLASAAEEAKAVVNDMRMTLEERMAKVREVSAKAEAYSREVERFKGMTIEQKIAEAKAAAERPFV